MTAMTYIARQTSARILRFFSGFSERGYCPRCERETGWMERDHYYRCTGCGQDPMMHRQTDTEVSTGARIYALNGRSAA
jgi:DNA-directed RNA polymerase subunit RPC12/RpoP